MHKFPKSPAKGLYPVILCLLITAVYTPTFSGEFILDDHPLVQDNRFIRDFGSPTSYLFHEDGVEKEGLAAHHTGYYRPLVNFFYTLDYKLWGMRALGFRLTNLILHLLTCFILYHILIILFENRLVSFLAALLFGLHPVNTETVAWVSARNNILVTLFSSISFYTYLKNSNEKKIWVGLLSYLSFAAALGSKEFAVMLLPIFFLYNRLMKRGRGIARDEILGYIPFVIILCSYLVLRAHTIGSALTPLSPPNLWKSIYFVPFLIVYNLKLILIPYSLHSFIVHYPKDYLNWAALAGFVGLGLLALWLWRERKSEIVLFSFLSFLVALFPVLNIVHTSAVTLVSMRWLYFPMIFLSASLAWYSQKLLNLNRRLFLGISVLVAVYLGTYSYILSQNLWHNDDTFFEQEVYHFDNYFYAGGLAESLFVKKNFIEAEKYFQTAINMYPKEPRNYINYAALLTDTGREDQALIYLDRTKALIKSNFQKGQWFNNRGMAYFQLGKTDKALADFLKAVAYWPYESQFWSNLGGAYGSLGDYRNSISSLKKGLDIDPDSIDLSKNLAVTYMRMGDYEKAILTLEKIPAHQKERTEEITALLRKARHELRSKQNRP
jgi:tetratricopeptide (TPR) repeat protein